MADAVVETPKRIGKQRTPSMLDEGAANRAGNGGNAEFGAWANGANHAVESWTKAGGEIMVEVADLAQDVMKFSNGRVRAGLDAWKALTACGNPTELFEVQRRFSEKAVADYAEQTNKLCTRILGAVSRAGQSLRREPMAKP